MNPSSPTPATPTRPQRRLSIPRLFAVIGVVAFAAVLVRNPLSADRVEARATTWFAPYVDVTLPPLLAFGDTRVNPADAVVLGFVVADPTQQCTPSWGGYYSNDEAATEVDLDRRLTALRRRGGQAVVSFGGAVNTELAVACTDTQALAAAYSEVFDRYDISIADFDIEGAALSDSAARDRRAAAVAAVQTSRADGLAVWLTLPAGIDGLTADGVATLDAFLAAGVDVSGVNAMTMNFGVPEAATSMSAAVAASMEATAEQVRVSFSAAGTELSDAHLWARLGATVMIGRNDVRAELFTLDDASTLVAFAHRHGLGRLSMWSMNRDAPCGPDADAGVAQNLCSGQEQTVAAYASLFTDDLRALDTAVSDNAATGPTTATSIDPGASRTGPVTDDPATAPYPIWLPGRGYVGGSKVVWHGNVYQANWWNENVEPDTPKANPWDSPWTLVGPVLPTDTAPPTTTIPPGVYPTWNPLTQYTAGSRVQHHGAAYQAKWFAAGQEPGDAITNPWETPWAQIEVTPEDLTTTTTAAAITSNPTESTRS